MNSRPVYLKQNVTPEPLFNRWSAWPGLIPPASAAMYTANSHLKIMQSFVAAPQVHAAALKNPAMRGGPFINYEAGQAGEIRALIERTGRERAHLLELAAAIQQLNETLAAEADGGSLEPLYLKIPDPLRGYVELVYDLNHHPSARYIEGLLYESRYYDESAQSIALSLSETDDRPFVMSTPHVGSHGRHLYLELPFRSGGIDELFRMRRTPRPLAEIREALGVRGEGRFASFFTEEPPPRRPAYTGGAVRVRYFGHACVLIETRGVSILCDPVISCRPEGGIFRYTYADLPERIDYLVLTHSHQDHCMFETLLQLRHQVREVIVPRGGGDGLLDPSLKMIMRRIGFARVREVDEMEAIEVEGGSITGVPFLGEHADFNVRTKIAPLVRLGGKSILCAADSNNIEPRLYEHVHRLVGDLDVLFLGMECEGGPLSWLYGPLLPKPLARRQDQSRRLDGSDYPKASALVASLRPRQVYVYAMGQEPWLTYLTSLQYTEESRPIIESNRLVAECLGRGLEARRLFGHGELHL